MRLHLILLMFFMLLGGCAQRIAPQSEPVTNWQSRLSEHKKWQVEGKIAFISPKERNSANLHWQHNSDSQRLRLTSFIGTQLMALEQTRDGARLDYDGEAYFDTQVDRLMLRMTGMQLPVAQADQWLKGLADDPNALRDPQGRMRQALWLADNGETWQIQYQSYVLNSGYWVPSSLRLKHDELTIKIKLSNWQFTQ